MRIRTPTDVPPVAPWKPKPAYDESLNHVCSYIRLLNHLGQIVDAVEEHNFSATSRIAPEDFTPHLATYLKLLLVASYARSFLSVGRGFARKLYYFDVLSASGLTFPGGESQPIPGSCLWVPLAYQEFQKPGKAPKLGFDRVWAFDSNADAMKRLLQRHEALRVKAGFRLPPLEPVVGDVNQTLPETLPSLKEERTEDRKAGEKGSLTLAFIDNVGLDVEMKTIAALQGSIRADLVVHLPVRAIWRSIQQAKKTDVDTRKLTRFFGDDAWMNIRAAHEIPAVYQEQVERVTGQEFQEFAPVYIRSENQEFALCIYVRRTAGIAASQHGWVAKIRRLANACDTFTPEMLRGVLDVARGKQATL